MTESSESMRRRFRNKRWNSGGKETPCGSGATVKATEAIREAIKEVILDYRIKSLLDLGCGDMNWVKLLAPFFEEHAVEYLGVDVRDFPEPPLPYVQQEFVHIMNPPADLALIKDVYIHLTDETVMTSLSHLNARYLLSTTWPNIEGTLREKVRSHAPINLAAPHFGIGEPIKLYEAGRLGKCLGLWDLYA